MSVSDITDDQLAVQTFAMQAAAEIGAAASLAMAILGDRLGLYRALASGTPLTAAELAARTGCAERYVREWLANQTAGGWVAYEPETARFELPSAHAAVVADEDSPVFMGGSIQTVGAIFSGLDRLTEAFRTGDGIGWGEQHADLHDGAARFFRTAYAAALPGWVGALDGVAERLHGAGRIADLGCGRGAAAIALAQSYPNVAITGFDMHRDSIERARHAAAAAGVAERAAFVVGSAEDLPAGGFDLVLTLDALHDMGDPLTAAERVRDALAPGGSWLIVEPAAADRLEDNLGPIARTWYATSTAFCTPCALSQPGGWALGNQAGEARLRDLLERAGFASVRVVDQTPFQLVLEARA
jgi:SAM-dependent methyltransferase